MSHKYIALRRGDRREPHRQDGTKPEKRLVIVWDSKTYKSSYVEKWVEVPNYVPMSDEEVMETCPVKDEALHSWKREQARIFEEHGFIGPLLPGEGRVLRRLMEALGFPNAVKRGWVNKIYETRRWGSVYTRERLIGPRLVFASPIPEIPTQDFLDVARYYTERGKNKAFERAIKEIMGKDTRVLQEVVDSVKTLKQLINPTVKDDE